MTDSRNFEKGDIVTFYESMYPWVVLGYHTLLSGEQRVEIKKICLPSNPHKGEVIGYAEEKDLILS